MVSKSYKTCNCGSGCDLYNFSRENEPCWGEVMAIDEVNDGDDWYWIHMCEGHADCYYNESYKPENEN